MNKIADNSAFVHLHDVCDFVLADWALLHVLGAAEAADVVLAGHVQAVVFLVTADDAGMDDLVYDLHLLLGLADIAHRDSDLEDASAFKQYPRTLSNLGAQPPPGAIRRALVLDIEFAIQDVNLRVKAREVLVLGERDVVS
jgi:hypothetical protein